MFKAGPHSKAAAILSTCTIEQPNKPIKTTPGTDLTGRHREREARNSAGRLGALERAPASSTNLAFNQFESRGRRGLRSTSFTAEPGHLEIF